MGQYYHIVNLDKKQYLNPHCFGDGLKLLEFGMSASGTLTALAILMSAGNGRGGGDFGNCTVPSNGGPVDHSAEFVGEEGGVFPPKDIRLDTHPLVGSWAADRVIIAGDYFGSIHDDPEDRKFPEECGIWTEEMLRHDGNDDWYDRYGAQQVGTPINPYSACGSNPEFVDISPLMVAVMANGDDYLRREMFVAGVVDEYGNVTYTLPSGMFEKYGWTTTPDGRQVSSYETREQRLKNGFKFRQWRRNLDPENFVVMPKGKTQTIVLTHDEAKKLQDKRNARAQAKRDREQIDRYVRGDYS